MHLEPLKGRETMSLRTPTPPGYGNSTRSLTLEAIKVALTKDRTGKQRNFKYEN